MRKSLIFTIPIAFLLMGVSGCGPLVMPMVMRLDQKSQQKVDIIWTRSLQPIDRLDRQGLLDVLVVAQLHHLGVDRLQYRSEKDIGPNHVVMEVFFDRAKPEVDRFVVKVHDRNWKLLRREQFSRAEIEQTMHDLNMMVKDGKGHPTQVILATEEKHKEMKQRIKLIRQIIATEEHPEGAKQ